MIANGQSGVVDLTGLAPYIAYCASLGASSISPSVSETSSPDTSTTELGVGGNGAQSTSITQSEVRSDTQAASASSSLDQAALNSQSSLLSEAVSLASVVSSLQAHISSLEAASRSGNTVFVTQGASGTLFFLIHSLGW